MAVNPDGTMPVHLSSAGTGFCRGSRKPAPETQAAPSGTVDPDARAETPRERGQRPSREERRAARFRERAILELEDGPAAEDLDDTLFRARGSRGGLPTLGRGHR